MSDRCWRNIKFLTDNASGFLRTICETLLVVHIFYEGVAWGTPCVMELLIPSPNALSRWMFNIKKFLSFPVSLYVAATIGPIHSKSTLWLPKPPLSHSGLPPRFTSSVSPLFRAGTLSTGMASLPYHYDHPPIHYHLCHTKQPQFFLVWMSVLSFSKDWDPWKQIMLDDQTAVTQCFGAPHN
ncbi:hypothetical protein NPIL_509461 [Nephila pilipes]|uniref:Uncharacterized protein n=1 Tax=Nephila pilipes TaxID=299642 RepID=A0A8X6N5P8_NEPPI|nr:hypothetical protein NPIL_509461 [Nephila pilipes]